MEEGRARADSARLAVAEVLDARMAGRPLPPLAVRLLRVALGGDYSGISPEVDSNVVELAAQLLIDDAGYSVRRRLVTTPTAPVEIAGEDEAAVLPALRPGHGAPARLRRR